VPAASFNGKSIRTVEGHAKNGELSTLQKVEKARGAVAALKGEVIDEGCSSSACRALPSGRMCDH